MGNRLSKIYTRTGDDGSTGMADGSRVSKADHLFSVMGDIDELNSHIGLVRAHLAQAQAASKTNSQSLPERLQPSNSQTGSLQTSGMQQNDSQLIGSDFAQALIVIQHLLFNIGGELAMPEYEGVNASHIDWLEQQIDAMNTTLPPLKDFILPTGSVLVSQLHVARTVCRRAERQAVLLQQQQPNAIRSTAVSLINRISDWLFVAARFCTDLAHVSEVLWDSQVLQKLADRQK
ncbi:cob(I)yrinic acid a,c-diamide adenosyltransferase [Psychrobacter urativorans]|uniref:Corrinoid adenosyltransferase n=1 Tax=Psychrobacter urativorans TaxID=45610 RepID=A0A0M3V9B0_9GAMM|nr:cob(I)yrinic acid a,c-diamide adenosyltransferase [Psychrobacter urativorans]ALF60633.1 cobalamin adenosyltransferase [Psychrobacter urativorans]